MSEPERPNYQVRFLKYVIVPGSSTQTPLTNAGLAIIAELITVFTFAAEGPGLVVADSVGETDLRILSALINV